MAGTGSDAGKSVLVAGLCRHLADRGLAVAPFKAANMSLNSAVTPAGEEVPRAQVAQARAARVVPEAVMAPVLLKPGAAGTSQLLVLGRPETEVDARGYRAHAPRLRAVTQECLAGLRERFDAVICEGAGSPAEVNLRASDVANLALARGATPPLPVVVVGDIDRGGVLAGFFGTLALLEPDDQALVAGFIVNKFRGDAGLLAPGLEMLATRTGRAVLGVLPFREGIWLDAEDSLDLAGRPQPAATAGPAGGEVLRVAVVRFPRISNVTDLDALASEPGVLVRLVSTPEELADSDLVVLPGTRATVADLAWLRARGLAEALASHVAAGRAVLGVCGGYQMLSTEIEDSVESRAGLVAGLGLLPVRTVFSPVKVLASRQGRLASGVPASGYEIRFGQVNPLPGTPAPGAGARGGGGVETLLVGDDGSPGGVRRGVVAGTTWHGLLEGDAARRELLAWAAAAAGRDWRPAGDVCFSQVREARLDALADLVARHLDVGAVDRLLTGGVPGGLPTLTTGLARAVGA